MNTDTRRDDNLARDALLKLLSDDEVARVSMKEGGPTLADGDEFIDLEHPDQGVRRMQAGTQLKMGQVLPRSAVKDATWSKICGQLAASGRRETRS